MNDDNATNSVLDDDLGNAGTNAIHGGLRRNAWKN
jgi:hypothetical protein